MGLFDFIKNAGKKPEDEANIAASLQKAVQDMGLNIRNIHVNFDDGLATIRGEAASVRDREMARLVVGNHEGVEKVNDDGLKVVPPRAAPGASRAPAPTPAAAPTTAARSSVESKMYTVQKGDTLSEIAEKFYGESSKYPQIFEANRPMLKDPDEIYPGQVLRIPPE